MTTSHHATDIPVHITALSIFEAEGVDLERSLNDARVLDEAGNHLAALGSVLWDAVNHQLVELARDFLQVDVGRVMVCGWTKYHELIEAADRTRGTDEIATVDLAGHDLSLHRHPSIDVVVVETPVATVPFDVGVAVAMEALTAVVRDGVLAELTSGRCEVTATLAIGEREVARASRTLDPHLVVPLGDGIALGAR